jgi:hypothetical protein
MSSKPEGTYERHWEVVRKWVCDVCLDQGSDGRCELQDRTCAMKTHLATLVDVVAPIESHRMDEYFDAVESSICARCEQRSQDGPECALRQRGDCALYAYLPLVVDGLQEALAADSAARARSGEAPAKDGGRPCR